MKLTTEEEEAMFIRSLRREDSGGILPKPHRAISNIEANKFTGCKKLAAEYVEAG